MESTLKNKTVLYSGTLIALSILFAGTISFASAHEGNGNFDDQQGRQNGNTERRLEMSAELLGVSVESLEARLEAGETMKEIMESSGIDKEQVMDFMKSKRIEHINQLVTDGTITQEQADERLERINSGEGHPRGPREHNIEE